MGDSKKIKVAMVCNMSNPMVRSHLPLDDGRIYNRIRKVLGMAPKDEGFHDYAIWNTYIAEEFGERGDVDLTIIAVHANMRRLKVRFREKNVNYVFMNHQLANLLKRFVKDRDKWLKINPFAKRVRKEIASIKPDIVVLMGLENTYYSCTVLGITQIPVYGLCQTVYNNPMRRNYGNVNIDNAHTEMRLFKELRYIGVYSKMHYELAKQYCTHSYIFKFGFPRKVELLTPTETKKEYDFVNFAMSMSSSKGYHDSVKALAIVKKKYPEVKLNLIGKCSDETRKEILTLIEELGLKDNVIETPFFSKQSDLFLHIQKSRFALLPCKMDNMSGTMMQAMQLGLPIVVYRTSGTPLFNKEKMCALIAERENIEELATHMIALMSNSKLADELRTNAREWQEKKLEYDSHNGERLIANFRAIIDNFKNETPIPQEQLYNPEIDD